MQINIKRAFAPPEPSDGFRILVDRLWPRGISKEKAKIDFWLRELSPSDDLRKWYDHDPQKWPEFKSRYFAELAEKQDLLRELQEYLKKGKTTFIFSSKEEKLNNATALKEYMESL